MFLMPPDLVRRAVSQIPESLASLEGARTVARALQVSARATVEHLYNLMLIDESDRDILIEQLGPPELGRTKKTTGKPRGLS